MITSQKELKRAIYDKKQKITEKEIFLSPEYNVFLTQMTSGVTKTTNKYESIMYCKDNELAYTNGTKTYINYMSSEADKMSPKEKHMFFCGLNLHENGHLLFTDFALERRSIEEMLKGNLYPSPAPNKYIEELETYLQVPGHTNVATNLYKEISNCIEDGFVDRAICKLAPGYGECLRFENNILRPLPEDTYAEMVRNKIPRTQIFTHMVYIYAVYGILLYDPATDSDEVIAAFEEMIPVVRAAVLEPFPMKRKKLILKVFCYLFHFFEQQSQNQQGQNQQGQNQQGQNQQSDMLSQMLSDAASLIPSFSSQHINASEPDKQAIQNLSSVEGKEESSANKSSSTPNFGEDELNKIAEAIAQSQVQKEQEKALDKQMSTDVAMFLDGIQTHKNIPCVTTRANLTEYGRKGYETQHQELDLIVKRFLKEFLKEIKDRQLGDVQYGLYAGKRFSSRDSFRYDKRIFNNKIAPEDIPNMAVGIMIDASGSMFGQKIEYATKCAYITYQFCRKLDIPCFIVAHSTDDDKVLLIDVVDENSLDGKDAQRIFEIKTHSCNRDGFSLRYCLGKLERVDADEKIMLVISDGKPNHNGYGFESGKKDLQSAVKDAIKKGITTIAAAIDDAEAIKKLYQDGISPKYAAEYMDLSCLEKLPKAFVKILKAKLS